jgi:hypothetical protein
MLPPHCRGHGDHGVGRIWPQVYDDVLASGHMISGAAINNPFRPTGSLVLQEIISLS